MKLTRGQILPLITVLLIFAVALFVYPQMPEKVASHWNINGQADGYMSRFWGTFLVPLISAAMYLLFRVIPLMDPKRQNIEKFRNYFDTFIALLQTFLLYIFAMTIIWNLGVVYNFNQYIIPPFVVLFYYIGILLEHAEMNWTIGIRTPWTLENKVVWDKTHKLGGLLFKACSIFGLLGIIFSQYAIWFVLLPIIFCTILIILYSYFIYTGQNGSKPASRAKFPVRAKPSTANKKK